MTSNENEDRPRMTAEAISENLTDPPGRRPESTEDRTALRLSRTDVLDAMPAYVLIVRTPTDRICRRVFLSLHSAVRACERAQRRGHAASLELAHYVSGGDPR